jgi:glycine/D-amino acid oxidase-like deaminating enzyme
VGVTLVERGEICAGSSYGNAGLLVPSHIVPLAAPGVWWQGITWMLDPESPFYIKPRLDPALLAWLWRFRAACRPDRARQAMPLLRELSVLSLELHRELAALEGIDCAFHPGGSMVVFLTAAGLAHGVEEARLPESSRGLEGAGRTGGARARARAPAGDRRRDAVPRGRVHRARPLRQGSADIRLLDPQRF